MELVLLFYYYLGSWVGFTLTQPCVTRLPVAGPRRAESERMFSRFGAHKFAQNDVTISALAQVPSHINTHLTNVIDENVQSSSKFVHNSVVVGT